MNVQATAKKVTKPAIKFGAATGGLIAGTMVASRIPELPFLLNIPVVGKYLARLTPGATVMVIAYLLNSRVQNELVKAGAFGMGLAGFANAFKRVTADIPMLQAVSEAIPAGLGRSQGHPIATQYPPDYYTDSDKAFTRVPMNGLGNAAYALEGGPVSPYEISGLGNTAYALEGHR